jgi:hypothetical protein
MGPPAPTGCAQRAPYRAPVLAIVQISTGYQVMGLLHIAAAIVAFGPLFLYGPLQRAGETKVIAALHVRVCLPALVLLWVLGMGLAGMSDDAFEVKQTWLALAIVIWLTQLAVSWFLIRPAIADRSARARARLSAGLGATHLLVVVALYLMIWKPGA